MLYHDIIQNKNSKLQVKLVTSIARDSCSLACGAGLSLRRMVGWFGSMFGFAKLFGLFRFEGSLVDSKDGYRWVDWFLYWLFATENQNNIFPLTIKKYETIHIHNSDWIVKLNYAGLIVPAYWFCSKNILYL